MLRIIPLIASATEIVHALGLGEFQVGRSHECDFPARVRDLPVCTRPRFDIEGNSREIDARVKSTLAAEASVYEVFTDVIERLSPTHLITQTQCQVCAVTLAEAEQAISEQHASRPKVVALEPNSLADIWRDIRRVADSCGVEGRGEQLVAELQSRMDEFRVERAAVKVVCIEWPEPVMAAGNWVPELIAMAGGVNLLGGAGRHSPWVEFGEMVAADPDVIISAPCGYGLKKARAEMHWLSERPEWSGLRAVRERRVYIADANQFITRPGPRVVESLQAFAEMERFAARLRGIAWESL